MLLFHRFLIQERVGKHRRSRDVILTTCLFLAGKVTEAPRRLRDVINVLHMLTCTGQDEPPLLDKVRTCPCVLLHVFYVGIYYKCFLLGSRIFLPRVRPIHSGGSHPTLNFRWLLSSSWNYPGRLCFGVHMYAQDYRWNSKVLQYAPSAISTR